MCGIFGLISVSEETHSVDEVRQAINSLFCLSESRGKEASGMAVVYQDKIEVSRAQMSGHEFIKTSEYKSYWQKLSGYFQDNEPLTVIGHSRLATNGLETNNNNNQPLISGHTVGIHNGIIVNEAELWREVINTKPQTEVDTEVLMAGVDKYYPAEGLIGAIRKMFKLIEGAASIAVINTHSRELALATNTGSIYYSDCFFKDWWVFASEKYILTEWYRRIGIGNRNGNEIRRLEVGEILGVDLTTKRLTLVAKEDKFKLPTKKESQLIYQIKMSEMRLPQTKKKGWNQAAGLNSIKRLKRYDFPYKQIIAIPRCRRCILPATTPFIAFNEKGVCNYCLNHHDFEYQGREALERRIKPFRSKRGEPDCLVGYSGGRDSSYGLAYVKEELKLNPIAYTYDWGMLSDYGRQNASRVTGRLGVEHVLVSAEISKKLKNIQMNIEAWCNKPDLGMVPLFMAGDKQSEYYMNELKRKTGIKLVIYCRGNEYEKEEFKSGYAGVKGADPKGVMHDLPWVGKLQLAAYYGRQFLTNPKYLNRSLSDTLSAYLATYVIPHNYLYLWHFIPWNEEQLVNKLRRDYNWQTPKETIATWRIDDGSPPFYNYIYYMVQGFTENDSLRSHQIRQGDLDRQTAWELACEENKPRYYGLQWYFDRIGMDGEKVLKVIGEMPKLY